METAIGTQKMLGGDSGGGMGLNIDSDQQIYGDIFAPIPQNPFSGFQLPQAGTGSGTTFIILAVLAVVVIAIISRRK